MGKCQQKRALRIRGNPRRLALEAFGQGREARVRLFGCGQRRDPGKRSLNEMHTARIKGEESPLPYNRRDTRGDVLPVLRCGLGYGFGVIDALGLV